jgi:hypothetical protein
VVDQTINGTVSNRDVTINPIGTGNVVLQGDLIVYNVAAFNDHIHIGPAAAPINFGNTVLQTTVYVNNFTQINQQNISNGNNASADYVVTADTGNDSNNYIDLGLNGSGYNQSAYNIGSALDGYLYVNGGNISIGTQTLNKDVVFHTDGTQYLNQAGRIHRGRWLLGNSTIQDDGINTLQVQGNISIARQGSGLRFGDGTWQYTAQTTGPTGPSFTGPTGPVSAVSGPTGYTGPGGYPTSRSVASNTPYNAINTDQYIGVTYAGATTINLAAGVSNQGLVIKDERGTAGTYPITINANGADTIDGQSSVILSVNWASLTLWYNTGWHII